MHSFTKLIIHHYGIFIKKNNDELTIMSTRCIGFFFKFIKFKPCVKLSFYDVIKKKKSLTLSFTFAVVLLKNSLQSACL